ncbi:unnamed protein product, partial [Prorocentrum cordatum]
LQALFAQVAAQQQRAGGGHRAEDLFAEWLGDGPAGGLDAEVDAASGEPEGDDGEESDSEEIDVGPLQALLTDNAAFFEACEAAVALAGTSSSGPGPPTLDSPAALRVALNEVCRRVAIEAVDEEESKELFDGPMDPGVFYVFAREYFSSISRALTMDIDALPPAGPS